ncbi:MAG: ATP-binding protein, partial [Polyangiaceae bacterium]|nr:ATP-binding protein [Polyangiaceae bacterium]
YRVLKDSDRYLKFVFITGVTKFAHVSIFSGLNQLTNLTLNPHYADICGFTHEEVMSYFASAIDSVTEEHGVDRDDYVRQLRQFYNGYRFSRKPTTVYNPFSLLSHFRDEGEFDSYWYESGTPSFLLKLFGERKLGFLDLDGRQISHRELKESGIESAAPEPMLVQSGYLTISDYDTRTRTYTLDYPNGEVRSAFADSLANHYFAASKIQGESLSHNLMKALLGGDPQQALLTMERFLASIPYDMVGGGEKYYHTAVHLTFAILGIECRSEVRTSSGRADSIVETLDYVYCFEFKIDKPVEEAIAQIDEKEYLKPWMGKGKKLFKVGVSFDSKKRNIGDSVVVEVPQ